MYTTVKTSQDVITQVITQEVPEGLSATNPQTHPAAPEKPTIKEVILRLFQGLSCGVPMEVNGILVNAVVDSAAQVTELSQAIFRQTGLKILDTDRVQFKGIDYQHLEWKWISQLEEKGTLGKFLWLKLKIPFC